MTSMKIDLKIKNKVATITLNRREKLNALTPEMIYELEGKLEQIEKDPNVTVVLVTGAGERAFCVGADINAWSSLTPLDMWGSWIRDGHRVFDRLASLPQPVVAVLNGYTFGGGLELALAADLRIAANTVQLAMPEVSLATVPGWGGTQRLAALIGSARAKQMIFTGDRIDAETAVQWGLLNWVVDTDALIPFAQDVVQRIAKNAPIAVKLAKQVIDGGLGVGTGVGLEALAGALATSTKDGQEGVRAFQEKRQPKFHGH
jgi:enoyl-CoA hydratase